MQTLFLLWLFWSMLGSWLMIYDKIAAKHNKKRISEKSLILVALSGACLFMWITMYLIHHKTKHQLFVVGFPILLLIQGILLFIVLN